MHRPFLIALQFLTRLPVTLANPPAAGEAGRSLLYYPIVGLLIGLFPLLTVLLLKGQDTLLAAALAIAVWALLTGGLHLDGLADTVDAWVGGLGDRERTLEIMKDPATGPMGVLGIALVLLLKTAAVHALLLHDSVYILLIPPVLARTCAPLLMISTPYARRGGLAAALAAEADRAHCLMVCGITALILLICSPLPALLGVLSGGGLMLAWRGMLLKRLVGYTGDTIGALIESVEVAVLIALALL
ncbi:MAG: adenosylcobinamide-GDP ribazoletransferase [Gammaproteobacteria bacterium]|nr:MAG: adenosylcobinamide-GDP ribazoletransferase [Gammaproteobacteria bacterium]